MSDMNDRVALITGASSGIGRATGEAFVARGAKVVLAARREHELATLTSEIESRGGRASFVVTDVAIAKDVERMVAHAIETFGRLDYAVNNAGIEGARAMIAERFPQLAVSLTEQNGPFLTRVMAALFLLQTLVGAASQHYRADLESFFGIDLARVMERVPAADENILNSTRSTHFITPKSRASRMFRDATLQLAEHLPFARRLVNSGRLSTPTVLAVSSLNTPDGDADFVEIASNDGYLLQYFVERSVPVLGVVGAVHPEAVTLSGLQAGDVGVPDEAAHLGQVQPLLAAGREIVSVHIPDGKIVHYADSAPATSLLSGPRSFSRIASAR